MLCSVDWQYSWLILYQGGAEWALPTPQRNNKTTTIWWCRARFLQFWDASRTAIYQSLWSRMASDKHVSSYVTCTSISCCLEIQIGAMKSATSSCKQQCTICNICRTHALHSWTVKHPIWMLRLPRTIHIAKPAEGFFCIPSILHVFNDRLHGCTCMRFWVLRALVGFPATCTYLTNKR